MREFDEIERQLHNEWKFTWDIVRIPIGDDMKITDILKIVELAASVLVPLVEGLFNWKKSGTLKKEFVTESVHNIVNTITENSAGGQKETWETIGPVADRIIEEAVSFLPAGAPGDAAGVGTQGS